MVQQLQLHISLIQLRAPLSASLTQQVVKNRTRFKFARPWLITLFKHRTFWATQPNRSSCRLQNKPRLYYHLNRPILVWDQEWNQLRSKRLLLRIFTKRKVPKLLIIKPQQKKIKLDSKSQLPDKCSILKLLRRQSNKLLAVKRS